MFAVSSNSSPTEKIHLVLDSKYNLSFRVSLYNVSMMTRMLEKPII